MPNRRLGTSWRIGLMPRATSPEFAFHKEFLLMQLQSARPFQPKQAVPYSAAALRQDLQRVRTAWEDAQASRDRSAIYGYLTAVYDLVAWWAAESREMDRARRALRSQRLKVSEREGPFAAVIRCTADPAKADKRTSGRGCCGTPRRTNRIPNPWIGSSAARGASTSARLGFPGA
jgi:hypothetical protein